MIILLLSWTLLRLRNFCAQCWWCWWWWGNGRLLLFQGIQYRRGKGKCWPPENKHFRTAIKTNKNSEKHMDWGQRLYSGESEAAEDLRFLAWKFHFSCLMSSQGRVKRPHLCSSVLKFCSVLLFRLLSLLINNILLYLCILLAVVF